MSPAPGDTLKFLMQKEQTAVRVACEEGHFDLYKLLQQHGASVDKEDLVRHKTSTPSALAE